LSTSDCREDQRKHDKDEDHEVPEQRAAALAVPPDQPVRLTADPCEACADSVECVVVILVVTAPREERMRKVALVCSERLEVVLARIPCSAERVRLSSQFD